MSIDTKAMKKRMLARKSELEKTTEQSAELRKPVELDQQSVGRLSRMDALQVQAMAKETERRRRDEIKRIESALDRIAEGEYGWCLTCGEQIAEKRLELDPTAAVCVDCARGGQR